MVTDYVVGCGPEPAIGSVIRLIYQGFFPDGTEFDSALDENEPLVFRKGLGHVVRGLDIGLEGLRVGGSREIVVPPQYG